MFLTRLRKYFPSGPDITPTPTPTSTPTPTPTPTPSPTPVSYNTGSLVFNSGSNRNQFLEIDNLANVATNADFTVEYYIKFNTLEQSADQTIFNAEPNTGFGGPVFHLYIDVTNNSTKIGRLNIEAGNNATVAYADNIQFDTSSWHHIAYVRRNKTGSMYYDGVEKTMTGDTYYVNSLSFTTSTNYIGTTDSIHDDLKANLTNFRFVNGTALYTASFTPSSVPLTNVTNTKLLLLTETNAAKYTDTSANCTISSNGSPAVAYSTQSPFPFSVIVPTPTPTPTPSATATPTPTPTPTATPTPTPTPAPPAPAPTIYARVFMSRSNPYNRSTTLLSTSPSYGTTSVASFSNTGKATFGVSSSSTYFNKWSLGSSNMSWSVIKTGVIYYGPSDNPSFYQVINNDQSTKTIIAIFK